jgi:UPF0755 protein
MKNVKNLMIVAAIAAVAAIYFGWDYYKMYFASNVPTELTDEFVCLPTGSTFDEIVGVLKDKGFIEDEASFRAAADKMNYKEAKLRAGRWKIKGGWNNKQLVQHLRSGEQAPVKVVFNYERQIENIAAKASRFIEADSVTLYEKMTDKAYLASLGYTPEDLMTAFIPNSYEMFWNATPEKFVERMIKEANAFWDKNDRRNKAKALNMTEKEVYTLASIVEKESNNVDERPTIAGAYLNRLKINMKLQADPTCVFATKDFATHRVTNVHLLFESPYNTYLHTGLPPGPISIASGNSIDAVLNRAEHNYIFFCAKPDNSGTHAFAETFAQHNVNVAKYIAWVNARGF